MERILPPVIRVFISSTFADMNTERQYFNTVIAPKLTRLCSERGVSFFSVDLRWGITEEDQISGNVIPICLREIDNCRPFFIGILGSRYGSILENITPNTLASFSWLKDQTGKSVTELEMFYGVLQNAEKSGIPDCVFCFRSDEMSKKFMTESESDEKIQKLNTLKKTIRQNHDIPSFDYNSIDEFGKGVISAVSSWLDKEFPTSESVYEVRKKWYNSEILRDYVRLEGVHEFFDTYCGSSSRSLMISGEGQRGKTTALTAWTPKDGEKILINCGADEKYQYWPAITAEIEWGLHEIDKSVGFPKFDAEASMLFGFMDGIRSMNDKNKKPGQNIFVTDYERESYRHGFISWLKSAKPKVPVYIVINDLNLIDDENAAYLNWLPSETGENIHIICSSNDETIIDNAQILGWNVKEMPLSLMKDSGIFLEQYMRIFGKNMSQSQKENLLKSPLMQYPGYLKYIIRYFNNYGNFENLSHLTGKIGRMTSARELYAFVLNNLLNTLQPDEAQAARTALFILNETSLGLREDTLYSIVREISPADAISWSKIRVILEQFRLVTADTWKIRDNDLRGIVQQFDIDRKLIHCRLGKYFLGCIENSETLSAETIKYRTDCAKSALYHFGEAQDWHTLSELLKDKSILYHLSKMEWNTVRSSWAKLLIFSDIDVTAEMMKVFEKCDDEYSDIRGIKRKIIGLMSDLELWNILHTTSKKSGLPEISELRDIDAEEFSPTSARAYERFNELHERGRYSRLLEETTAFLARNEGMMNDAEKCCFYMLKIESERELGKIEEGLETSYKYYVSATSSMDNYEIIKALRMRGQFLYSSGRYTEAQKILLYSGKLALNIGDVRDYLSSSNDLGMCADRQKRFSDSIKIFESCIKAWKRLGDDREVLACWTNKCNALYFSGNVQEAADETEKLIDFIGSLDEDEHKISCAMAWGNLGLYCSKLGQTEKAEAAYLRSIEISRTTEFTRINNYSGLIILYRKQNKLTKAIEICEEYTELLYRNKIYDELAYAVKECVYLMQMGNYSEKAEEFREKWRKIFDTVPGGLELFGNAFLESSDPLLENQLKEELTVARSEKDSEKCGVILKKLAGMAKIGHDDSACDLYIEAIDAFSESGNKAESYECACQAIRLLIDSGTGDSRFKKVYKMFTPSDMAIISQWLMLREKSISDESYVEGIAWILRHSENHGAITAYCLLDEIAEILKRLPAENLSSVGKWIKDDPRYDEFEKAAYQAMGKNKTAGELAYLRRNYRGTRAEEMLATFERYIAFLEAIGSEYAGALAGETARVYRRRKDKERTISNHEKAIRIYRKHKKPRDVYIELMNLATAYKHFGLPEQAAELMRNTLKEPELSSIRDIHAAIAGNLASLLVDFHSRDMNTDIEREIAECFSIEEKYFEESGEMRELAISLFNQIVYFMKHRKQDKAVINEKLKRLENIVVKYSLSDFEHELRRLKMIVNR